ncbi:MAG: DUF5678 domain-containing protein [Microgenomates group bacterium]
MRRKIPSFTREQEVLLAKWNRYKGKIVAVVGGRIFSAETGKEAEKMIKNLEKKYKNPPLVTYIPKSDTLILLIF